MLLHSWWMIPSLMGGFFTWAGFLYIGLRHHSRRWTWWGVAYLVLAAALCLFIAGIPDAASPLNGLAAIGLMGLWLGGMLHSFYANLRRLTLLSAEAPRARTARRSGAPAREISGRSVPATQAARDEAGRRPERARTRAGRQSGPG